MKTAEQPGFSLSPSIARDEVRTRGGPIRVAVLCDFLEERWPSMDLAGDMLCRHLEDRSDDLVVTKMRPVLRRRLTRIPLLEEKLAWNADRLINRFADYPIQLRNRRDNFDLFHIIDHSYAHLIHSLPCGRTVVTCHDLDTFVCLLEPERNRRPGWFRAMSQRILDGFRRADHFIAVSAATRGQLLQYNLCPPERISVVPNGVHPSCSPLPDPCADAAVNDLLPIAGPETIFLLSVGSTLPRKRLDVLLRVFAAVRQDFPDVRLIRVGGLTPAQLQLAAALQIKHAILHLPFLERNVLAAVYRRADLLLHTAEAEGFGLPLIEAMACGCPVIASDVPVLREVGGAAASYCPVADINAWKDTTVHLLRDRVCRGNIWELRRQQGLTHAGGFSWAENARQTALIYQQVLQQRQ